MYQNIIKILWIQSCLLCIPTNSTDFSKTLTMGQKKSSLEIHKRIISFDGSSFKY